MQEKNNVPECRSMTVEECAALYGIGRARMYNLANAAARDGKPFAVQKLRGKLLISRKSFYQYLDSIGF